MIYQHPLAYLLGIEGVALLRSFAGEHDRDFIEERLDEIRRLLDSPQLQGDGVTAARVSAPDGYRIWSQTYDEPGNGLFPLEEPIVHQMIDALEPGVALDAACGTGRHTQYLASAGYDVIGVDSSPEMLRHARARVPQATLRDGELDRLPVPDAHVDLIVCSLALTHLSDLRPAFAEFARVLRPGGHLVISDVHHEQVALGSVPRVRSADGAAGLISSYRHRAGDYLAAALPLALQVRRLEEPCLPSVQEEPAPAAAPEIEVGPWDGWPWSLMPLMPAAVKAAWAGVPILAIWQFQLADVERTV